MFNLALETRRTHRNLVTGNYIAATGKRFGGATISDGTNRSRRYIGSIGFRCTTCT